jgi:isochorismate synthase
MKFTRLAISPLSAERLRSVAARDGFLVESPDVLRVGIGGVVDQLTLLDGFASPGKVEQWLNSHDIAGDEGLSGTGLVAFASLPFDTSQPSTLSIAAITISQWSDGSAWLTYCEGAPNVFDILDDVDLPSQETQLALSLTRQPSGEEYAHSVAVAVEQLRRGDIKKVVLARSVHGTVDEPIDCAAVAHRLRRREPRCTIYAMPLPDGRRFVGASPELLVARTGDHAVCHPLAGTIALPPNVAPDDYQNWLLGSGKNLHEHRVLVQDLTATLEQYYDNVEAPDMPSIVPLRTVAHLGTWIHANLPRYEAVSALELLSGIHPTAAVGGLPREKAIPLLHHLEQHDRGHYAGPVGWIDGSGDGEWWLGIRGVFLAENRFEAWAGAGIVSESDPVAEREETRDKLASVLAAVIVDRP